MPARKQPRVRKQHNRLSTIMKRYDYADKRKFLIDLLERHTSVRNAAEEIGMTYQGLYAACESNGITITQEKQVKATLE